MKTLCSFLICLGLLVVSTVSATPVNTKYFSAKGNTLVHVDIQRMQASQTFKDLINFVMMNPQSKAKIDEFKKSFGIDIFRDVQALSLHMTSRPNNEPDVVVHVQGNFTEAQVLKGLSKDGALTATKIGTFTLHQNTNKTKSVVFISAKEMLIGESSSIQAGLTKSGQFAGPLKALSTRIKTAQDIWVVTHLDAADLQKVKTSNPMLGNFPEFVAQVNLAKGLHVKIDAISTSAAIAQSTAGMLSKQIEGFKANPQAMMFMGILNKLKVSAQQNDLSINVPLNQQDVNQLKMIAGMIMMGMQKKQAPSAAPARPQFPSLKGPQAAPKMAPKMAPKPAPAPAPAK